MSASESGRFSLRADVERLMRYDTIRERIREAIRTSDATQAIVADSMGWKASSVSKALSGRQPVPLELVYATSTVTGMPVAQLLGVGKSGDDVAASAWAVEAGRDEHLGRIVERLCAHWDALDEHAREHLEHSINEAVLEALEMGGGLYTRPRKEAASWP